MLRFHLRGNVKTLRYTIYAINTLTFKQFYKNLTSIFYCVNHSKATQPKSENFDAQSDYIRFLANPLCRF